MARKVTSRRVWVSTVAAWFFGFLIFLPILWMVLTSFKTELEAFAMPPTFLFFHWTTENYATVQGRSDYLHHALNSIIAGGSTLIAMLIAVPAAWSMAFAPTKRTKDILLWMLSTKMMPPVGVLVPIYLLFRNFGLLDTRAGWSSSSASATCRSSSGCCSPISRKSPRTSSRRRAWMARPSDASSSMC